MGNINPAFNDRVRYTLRSNVQESLIITEPVGWKDDEKEFARHEKYHGIAAKFSNSLKFIHSGAEYIQFIIDVYDINEQIELIREEKHPVTDVWTLSYTGFLDLSTWERENNQVSVKFNSGGLEQLLKSREAEKVEIDRTTTIDGKIIPELVPIEVDLEGRRIFLKTTYNVKPSDNRAVLTNTTIGNTRGSTISVPITLVNKSHEEAHSPIPATVVEDNSALRTGNGEIGNMFFAISERRRILKIKFTLKFTPIITAFDNVNWFNFYVRLATYQLGSSFIHKSNRFLFAANSFVVLHRNTFTVNFDDTIILEPGESLALEFDQLYDGANSHSSHLDINIWNIECPLDIEEDSFVEKTKSKAVLAHEFMDRLVTIATNQEGVFYSDYLGRTDIGYPVDGTASITAMTHGFWVRGFDKLPIPEEGPPKVENLFKPLTTSIKDAVDSLAATWNVGLGIETIGRKERVRVEELGFFYNPNVTIRLPNQVKKVKRSNALDKYYSSVEIGYQDGGVYEEACGLDEYNKKSTFTTFINRIKNPFSKLSIYRGDMYGLEFTRRKQKSLNNTIDTSRDNSIWILDLKRSILGNVFKQRVWQDDFENEPTGIFSPETATNLRLSPLNCLIRSSWWFSGCLKAYISEYTRYASSDSNSKLKTKFIGKNDYREDQDIINSELLTARFLPKEIEFEHECDFGVMQQIEGTTMILGKEIKNFYGTVEFINENNELERGFILNIKPNGTGKWRVLKSNR